MRLNPFFITIIAIVMLSPVAVFSQVYHDADLNKDGIISHGELLRIIEFWRAGGYLYDESGIFFPIDKQKEDPPVPTTDIYPLLGNSNEIIVGVGKLHSAILSSDGKYFATCGNMGAFLWDMNTGELLKWFSRQNKINAIAFSPDSSTILTGGEDKARLWDNSSGAELLTFTGLHILSVNFSSDGSKVLTGSAFGGYFPDLIVGIWDVNTGNQLKVLSSKYNGDIFVTFSPDSSIVAASSGYEYVNLLDATTGNLIHNIPKDQKVNYGLVYSLQFSPDGLHLITGHGYGKLNLWDVNSGDLIYTFFGHTNDVTAVDFSPDGSFILSGSNDQTAKLWDVKSGLWLQTFLGHTDTVHSAVFAKYGESIFTGSRDSTVRLWDTNTGKEVKTYYGHSQSITSVAFSPDGTKILTGNQDKTSKLWDSKTGKLLQTFSGHKGSVSTVAFSSDGLKVLTGSDTTVKLWNVGDDKAVHSFSESTYIRFTSFSSNDKLILGAGCSYGTSWGEYYGVISVWDIETGVLLQSFRENYSYDLKNSSIFTEISPDDTKVLLGSGAKMILWNRNSKEKLHTYNIKGIVNHVNFIEDGKKIRTFTQDGNIQVWSVETGLEVSPFPTIGGIITSVDFSPDGSRILTGNDSTLKLWDTETGQLLNTFFGHLNGITSVASLHLMANNFYLEAMMEQLEFGLLEDDQNIQNLYSSQLLILLSYKVHFELWRVNYVQKNLFFFFSFTILPNHAACPDTPRRRSERRLGDLPRGDAARGGDVEGRDLLPGRFWALYPR